MTLIIIALCLGQASGLLVMRSYPIARALWPGPSVKGPGDVYVQAFQTLICMAALIVIALISSLVAFALSARLGWRLGMYFSIAPFLSVVLILLRQSIRSSR